MRPAVAAHHTVQTTISILNVKLGVFSLLWLSFDAYTELVCLSLGLVRSLFYVLSAWLQLEVDQDKRITAKAALRQINASLLNPALVNAMEVNRLQTLHRMRAFQGKRRLQNGVLQLVAARRKMMRWACELGFRWLVWNHCQWLG